MSSSVLGLGAAGLGAAAMGRFGGGQVNKQKKVSTPQPSAQDYLNSYMSTILNQKISEKRRVGALFGGPIKSATGNFFYNEAPKKIPEGAFVVRGEDINIQQSSVNAGSSTKTIPTYQVIRPQGTQQQPTQTTQTEPLRLNLSHGGRVDVLNTKDIQQAVEGGATLQQIRQTARAQDLRVAPKAQEMLRPQQQQTPQLRLDLSQGGRVDVLNRQDIKHAVAQGATMQDVRQAARAQDLRVSAKAKSMLQKDKKNNS